MTLEEIRGLATEDLVSKVEDSREELFKMRYARATESVENTNQVRQTRKRIARIKTVLRERELEAAKSAQSAVAEGAES